MYGIYVLLRATRTLVWCIYQCQFYLEMRMRLSFGFNSDLYVLNKIGLSLAWNYWLKIFLLHFEQFSLIPVENSEETFSSNFTAILFAILSTRA